MVNPLLKGGFRNVLVVGKGATIEFPVTVGGLGRRLARFGDAHGSDLSGRSPLMKC